MAVSFGVLKLPKQVPSAQDPQMPRKDQRQTFRCVLISWDSFGLTFILFLIQVEYVARI